MSVVKKLVYNYIFHEVLTNIARSDMPEDFLAQDTLNLVPSLQVHIDRIIQPIKNRLQQPPLNKEIITANPFTVLNVMAFILDLYEQKNVQAQRQQPEQQRQRRPQPRLFSLFPNSSYKWRFIKLDGENLNTIFRDTRLLRQYGGINKSL
ncbi:hypothetical protein BCV72DRAFT_82419 [Rhizopus microsporus var. microsporus]|uniref:Uncharacterized protein n=1 Tax=Rhizopus microsporus var. microsporus TaxID=86635 RepID=A0A1X0QN79_RHIZD|nr:hypothetical protein BCV72DRAFT_82419 [Rhizopus microsporus var. microsporus]